MSFELETERLLLRDIRVDDAPFMLELLTEPSFIHFIGDKGVRTLDETRQYILDGPIDSYERHGLGMYLVILKETGEATGISGLVKRETLDDVDVGFAFLPRFWSRGYAYESTAAVMSYARGTLGLDRILGITAADNASSIRLLEKIGLRFDKMIRLTEDEPEIKLFVSEVQSANTG